MNYYSLDKGLFFIKKKKKKDKMIGKVSETVENDCLPCGLHKNLCKIY